MRLISINSSLNNPKSHLNVSQDRYEYVTPSSSGSAQQMVQLLRFLAHCNFQYNWVQFCCFDIHFHQQIVFIPMIADISKPDTNCKAKFIICCHSGMLAVEKNLANFHALSLQVFLSSPLPTSLLKLPNTRMPL